jgi:ribonuclease HI
MSDPGVLTIHTDGAARGNPGPAAWSYIIERAGHPDIEVKEAIGTATNNFAEYSALVRALEHARKLEARQVNILSDSDLLVQQMNGNYKVRNEGLLPLYHKARELCKHFDSVTFRHIRREQNKRADRLCNEALDGEAGAGHASSRGKKSRAARVDTSRVDQEAIECLRLMASAWAHGNPNEPKPEDVWDQLRSILEEAGILGPTHKN